MKIFLACPAPPRSRKGNRVTASRWAAILHDLGYRVKTAQNYDGSTCDLLIALHARRSFSAVRQFHRLHPSRPLIVALTGTDLYRDIRTSRSAQHSLEWADRLVVLQPCGIHELPARLRFKARVIYQSAERVRPRSVPDNSTFDICVLGHMRGEKDPLRAALALRLLPASSRVRVIHAGEALSNFWESRARAAEKRDARYRWLGEIPRRQAQRLLVGSRVLVLSSRMEGGANVISEAIVNDVPVLASWIPGNRGLLGEDYPGYFPAGDTRALAGLMFRAENDRGFYSRLKAHCFRLAPRFTPARERAAWARLLAEFTPSPEEHHAH